MFDPGDNVSITMDGEPWGYGVVIRDAGSNVWTRVPMRRSDGGRAMKIYPFSPRQLIRELRDDD